MLINLIIVLDMMGGDYGFCLFIFVVVNVVNVNINLRFILCGN